MNNCPKTFLLLLLGVSLSAFLYASNVKRKIPVRSTPDPTPLPESDRVPPRTFCPFELFYDQDLRVVEILLVDEVDYLSYSIETSDGILVESGSLGFIPEGTSLSVSLGANTSSQCEMQLSCNYGVYCAAFTLEYEE